MSRDYTDLIRNRLEVLSSIAKSTAAIDRPQIVDELHGLLEGAAARLGALSNANAAKGPATERIIHRAADNYFTPRVRAISSTCYWPSSLRSFLERRYFEYGLKRPPALRTIRVALDNWTPPYGSST